LLNLRNTGADVRFYKGGCPIHLKGAPEVERRRRGEGWGLENFSISYIKMVRFVIFIDAVAKKGTLVKRAGVRTLWTPPGSAPAIRSHKKQHKWTETTRALIM